MTTTIVLTDEQRANVAAWCDALESGKYAQTKETLHRVEAGEVYGVGYCCLGVACDLIPGLVRTTAGEFTKYDGCADVLPDAACAWYGMASDNGFEVTIDGFHGHLTDHNDARGATFAQIAAAIREQILR